MLQQRPTLDSTRSSWYHVRAQVDLIISHVIQSARDHIAELYDPHRSGSDAECLELIDSLLLDNQYLVPLAEHMEDGVHGPNRMQRESKTANEWLAATFLIGAINPAGYLDQIISSGE